MKLSTTLTASSLVISACLLSACGDSSEPSATGGGDAASTPAAGSNILTTELPEERLEGTPIENKLPNLVEVPKVAPQLAVPDGTALISAGKPATASDDFIFIGDLSYLTDGDKQAGEGYYVEVGQDLQWVQIDLEAVYNIDAVWVWHYHSQRRAYHDVIIQISNDESFESGVTTIYNNDYDNSAEMGKGNDPPYIESRFGQLVDGKGTSGRYVRLHANGNTANENNHYTEVEIFGRPAE
ncbi:MAG: discoidin domain-containing protein [Planctomycetota bacterium]